MLNFSVEQLRAKLGPLAPLVGVWEGDKGHDVAPSDDRGSETNLYRERITFEQISPVQNHEQNLHVLRYSTRAWRIGDADTFHEELGYWSWEPANHEVMRSFLIPRGIALIAGGKAPMDASEFHLVAKNGSCTFGICTNPFLDREFKIVSYELFFHIHSESSFSYEQDTVIQMPGHKEPFHIFLIDFGRPSNLRFTVLGLGLQYRKGSLKRKGGGFGSRAISDKAVHFILRLSLKNKKSEKAL